jgi:hypothetical protein
VNDTFFEPQMDQPNFSTLLLWFFIILAIEYRLGVLTVAQMFDLGFSGPTPTEPRVPEVMRYRPVLATEEEGQIFLEVTKTFLHVYGIYCAWLHVYDSGHSLLEGILCKLHS